MIPRISPPWHAADWQSELAKAVREPAEFLELLELPRSLLPAARAAAERFPLRVPRGFIARMKKGDIKDPLLRQVLPLAEETRTAMGFSVDPVGDLDAMPASGVLHKYHGRVLLVTTGACAVHCRYCFRRHFPYHEYNAGTARWQAALDFLAADESVKEVILSGGDPLTLSDTRLATLVHELEAIPHLEILRIHTRLPVVLPERVDTALLSWLGTTRLKTVVVIHANHAQEFDTAVDTAIGELRTCGATLLNQAVLLRGVNDCSSALTDLSQRLFGAGVMPYYLHVLDKVDGAAHFDVDLATAQGLMMALRRRLPGYLVPRLVQERAGAPYKLPLSDTIYPAQ